jgi:replication-associated recombination protein RarA
MLTLHGPPGTGKTTLAKVLAKKCGYEVRHVNASDVRTGAKLLEAIKDAMTNDSHFDSKKIKPHCLIIDEVDGAILFEDKGFN